MKITIELEKYINGLMIGARLIKDEKRKKTVAHYTSLGNRITIFFKGKYYKLDLLDIIRAIENHGD